MNNFDLEQQLKNETSSLCHNVLNNVKNHHYITYETKKKFSFKKLSIVLACCLCVLFIPFGMYYSVYETITIDCNPSIELKVNIFDKVIDVKFNNIDAEYLYYDLKYKNRNLEIVTNDIIDHLYIGGYLSNDYPGNKDNYNLVIISGYGKGHSFSDDKISQFSDKVSKYCESKDYHTDILGNSVSKKDDKQSKEHDISYGKLRLINEIIRFDDHYTFDDLKNMSMEDLKKIYKSSKHH